MLSFVANFDPLTAGADEVFQCGVQVQGIAHLVKIGHFQFGASSHLPAVGFELAQNQFKQGCFAGAIGAQQSNFVATQQGAGELLNHRAHRAVRLRETLAHIRQLGHQLAAGHARRHLHAHVAHFFATRSALRAQILQASDAALTAGSAGLYAFANPNFLLGQQLIGLGLNHGFLCELFFFLNLVLREIARVWA